MKEDAALLFAVFAVWTALAAVYALVPTFQMPGYAGVWAAGAAIFLALALTIALCQRGSRPSG